MNFVTLIKSINFGRNILKFINMIAKKRKIGIIHGHIQILKKKEFQLFQKKI